jgi:hypothetical protein
MEKSSELLHQVGSFEPNVAKKLLPLMEAHQIGFEVEPDNSALYRPERTTQMIFGMYPDGSKLAIFVREADLPKAKALAEQVAAA